jgi:hypothetical protein
MKRVLSRSIMGLLVANIVLATVLLVVVLFDSFRSPGGPAQLDATPSPSFDLMSMGLAHIPTTNSCLLCHETGGEGSVKPIPALGHPLEGWARCVVCHTDESLGRTAPGHTGIDEKECTNCHTVAQPGPAITQAHSALDQPCLDCHGDFAHLPSSMVGRNEDECWLCHKPAPSPPPQKPHPTYTRLDCRDCHRAADVGALPIDHALRADTTCELCHDVRATQGLPSSTPVLPTPGESFPSS